MPEAEPFVGPWRRRYARDAAEGMWAHVTLLYPFREGRRLGEANSKEVAAALSCFRAFPFALTRVAYFHEPHEVLYLVPEPSKPFADLTLALAAAFPNTPPYAGIHADVVPHVSVADRQDPVLLGEIEAELATELPIEAVAREVELVVRAPTGWTRSDVFRLAV